MATLRIALLSSAAIVQWQCGLVQLRLELLLGHVLQSVVVPLQPLLLQQHANDDEHVKNW